MHRKAGTVALIALLAAFVPLSMDLYLPALPQMMVFFHADELTLNATLYLFYLFMALGMILLGPLSDRFGRKALLMPCALGYTFACIGCSVSLEVWQLISCRVIQACCVGALMALSTAMIKDSFSGEQMEAMLGVTQAMSLVAPMAAPVLGALILQVFPWQAEFAILSLFGMLAFFLALFRKEKPISIYHVTGTSKSPVEPASQRTQGVFTGVLTALRDRTFVMLLVVTSVIPVGYMAYVSSSSYIYQDQFGLSEMQFSLFYAVNATVTVVASLAYMKIRAAFAARRIMNAILIFTTLSGLLICAVGYQSAPLFMICFLPNAFFCTLLKPFSTSLLLHQRESDAGAASSLINFTQTIFSCLGLLLGSLPWWNMAQGLGTILLVSCIVGAAGWIILRYAKGISIIDLDKER